jgi:hypothetical protein
MFRALQNISNPSVLAVNNILFETYLALDSAKLDSVCAYCSILFAFAVISDIIVSLV